MTTDPIYYEIYEGKSVEFYFAAIEDELSVERPCPHVLEVSEFYLLQHIKNLKARLKTLEAQLS